METNALAKFNTQYTQYINYDNGIKLFDLTIQDIISVASKAYENNRSYNLDSSSKNDQSTLYVNVNVNSSSFYTNKSGANINGNDLEQKVNNDSAIILKTNLGKKYKCTNTQVLFSTETGRVYSITFDEEP